jgi:hypothetical protein
MQRIREADPHGAPWPMEKRSLREPVGDSVERAEGHHQQRPEAREGGNRHGEAGKAQRYCPEDDRDIHQQPDHIRDGNDTDAGDDRHGHEQRRALPCRVHSVDGGRERDHANRPDGAQPAGHARKMGDLLLARLHPAAERMLPHPAGDHEGGHRHQESN